HRRGVPQGRDAHAPLARGGRGVDELFPGLAAEGVAAGAPRGDLLGGIRGVVSGHRLRQVGIGEAGLFPRRPFLEGHVRARVRRLPGLALVTGDIVDLVTTGDRRAVTGVRVRDDAGVREIHADLVVDATGRGSRTPLWLERLGYPRPRADQVHVAV